MSEPRNPHPFVRALPALTLLAGAGFWLWLAVCVHTMPVVGGEIDHYVQRAEALLQGHLGSDRLHPMGLSLLIAAVAWCGVEPFLAGKLVGVVGALLLVTATYRVMRHWTGRLPATLAAIAVGASPYVLYCGVQAASDVPAAACVALALLGWTRAAAEPRTSARRLLLSGIALGFAGALRMPSLAFAPAFVPLLFGVGWGERARRVAGTAIGGLLGLAPHLVTMYLSTGSLFQNTTQIVWKYRYLNDYDAFLAYLDAPTPVSSQELREWLTIGFGDWLAYLGGGLGRPWSLELGWLAAALSLGFVLALLLPLLLRRRAAAVLAIGAWSYSLLLCVLSLPLDRLTIPMAMPAVVLATAAWLRLPQRMCALPTGLALLLAALAVIRMPTTLDHFERLHARQEMDTTRQLIARHGEWITVAMPAVGIERGIPAFLECFVPSEDVPMAQPSYWDRLLANAETGAARFVIVSARTWPQIHAEMATQPPPPGYDRLQDGEVLIFEKRAAAGWCERASVQLVGDDLQLSLQLAPGIDRTQVAGAGFIARNATGGEWQPLVLPLLADGSYGATLLGDASAPLAHWTFVPAILSWDASKRTAPAIELEAPARTRGMR